jgi:hypothetical protein
VISLLFEEITSKQKAQKAKRVKRPDRNRKEKVTQAQEVIDLEREELSRIDFLELMGANDRGFKRRRGAWRKA